MKTKPATTEDIDRLEDIREEITELLDEAMRIVRGTSEYERARAYWYPHILTALSTEHEYLGSSMVTLADTIQKLRDQDEEADND